MPSAQTILLEQYMGSKPEIKLIEKEFAKLVKFINANTKGDKVRILNVSTAKLSKRPEVKKIEMLTTKAFGVKSTIFNFVATDDPNAYTVTGGTTFLDSGYKKNARGEMINKQMTMYVFMNAGLVTRGNLDAGELTAIYLHEVGHNFDLSFFFFMRGLSILTPIDMAVQLLSKIPVVGKAFDLPSVAQTVYIGKTFIEKTIFSIPGIPQFRTLFQSLMAYVSNVQSALYPLDPGLFVYYLRSFSLFSAATYGTEKYADRFATDLGYGPKLASGLEKIHLQENSRSGLENLPLTGWIYDFNHVTIKLVSSMISGYPTEENRVRTILDNLDKSMNDPDIDPRAKKELLKQQKEMKAQYERYLEISKDEKLSKPFTALYRSCAEQFFDGKMDLREFAQGLNFNFK